MIRGLSVDSADADWPVRGTVESSGSVYAARTIWWTVQASRSIESSKAKRTTARKQPKKCGHTDGAKDGQYGKDQQKSHCCCCL